MDEKQVPKYLLNKNKHSPLLECIKDGLLYTISLMIVITLANKLSWGTYIQDSKAIFIDYFIYGIAVCIIHYISDKISIYLTSNLIMNSLKEKKPLSGKVFLLPWVIEILFDAWLLVIFGFLSVNVMFDDMLIVILMTFIIRLLNGLIESIINTLFRRGKND